MYKIIGNFSLSANDYAFRTAKAIPFCQDKTDNPYVHFYKSRCIQIFKVGVETMDNIFELYHRTYFFDTLDNNCIYYFQDNKLVVHDVSTNKTHIICDMPKNHHDDITNTDLYEKEKNEYLFFGKQFKILKFFNNNIEFNIISFFDLHIFLDTTRKICIHTKTGYYKEIEDTKYIVNYGVDNNTYYDIVKNKELVFESCRNILPISGNKMIVQELYKPQSFKLISLNKIDECIGCASELTERMIMVPCGHSTVCKSCLKTIDECPYCGKKIEQSVKLA